MRPDLAVNFMLGFAVAASFGPINLLLTRRALIGGASAAIPFSTGAALGDAVLLLAAVAISRQVSATLKGGYLGIGAMVSGACLVLVSIYSLVSTLRPPVRREAPTFSPRRELLAAMFLTVTSPFGILLWISVGSTLVTASESKGGGTLGQTYIVVQAIAGDLVWFAGWTCLVCLLRQRIRVTHLRFLGVLADLCIGIIGIIAVIRGIALVGDVAPI
jgi:threonine/homoserine/homoserine lactone efflux protein